MSVFRLCGSASQKMPTGLLSGFLRVQPTRTLLASSKSLAPNLSSRPILEMDSRSQVGYRLHDKISPGTSHSIQIVRASSSGPLNRPKVDSKDEKEYKQAKQEYFKEKEQVAQTIKFKQDDLKEKVKKFYSLYGPLFIICHITVSLASVGFFYTIVYFTVDPMTYLPESVVAKIGEKMRYAAGESSKFVIAYAMHKMILPVRLGGSIYLTQRLSKTVKFPWLNRAATSDKN